MDKRLKYSIIAAVLLSVTFGTYAFFQSGIPGIGWFIGVLFIIFSWPLSYFRLFNNVKTSKFNYNFEDSKEVIYTTVVNYYDEIYYSSSLFSNRKTTTSMGGQLYLLNDRLVFQTNSLNHFARREVIIFITDVYCVSIDFDCTFGKSFAVETDTNKYGFYSGERDEWKTQILRRKAALI
ncbi:hypothetical protein AAEO56_17485 [Flavobacterium sp. DGU11]|uniref:GRAM domain-containing protein n=1 Tax=Flavobacterium arundinis TaxID=3139143 RepID=A0ABU9I1N9_9FLAO